MLVALIAQASVNHPIAFSINRVLSLPPFLHPLALALYFAFLQYLVYSTLYFKSTQYFVSCCMTVCDWVSGCIYAFDT